MKPLLDLLARLTLQRPRLLLTLAIVPPLLLGLVALRTPIDLSFTGILDRSDPEIDRYFDTMHTYGLGGSLTVLLEGPEESLDEAVGAVAQLLLGLEPVAGVTTGDLDLLLGEGATPGEERDALRLAPWWVPEATFDSWLAWAVAPLDSARLETLRAELEGGQRRLWPHVPGARLLRVRLKQDPLDAPVGSSPYFEIEERVEALLGSARSPVSLGFSGLPAVAAQDQARTLGKLQRLTPLSLLLALLLFRLVERRLLGLAFVLVPMVLSVVATLGAVGGLLGSITVMETFFGVTVFGLGIDFAIHLLVRFREERAAGRGFEDAVRRTVSACGAGIVAGGATTAGAFLVVALAPDPIARHLGLSGGFGLLFCLALMLTALPALWALDHARRRKRTLRDRATPRRPLGGREETPRARHRGPDGPQPHDRALEVPGLETITRASVRHPRTVLTVAGLLILVAATGIPRLRTETDLTRVFNRDVPALATVERVQELFEQNGAPWFIVAEDYADAERVGRELVRHPVFARVESLATLVPPGLEQRAQRLDAEVERLGASRALIESLTGLGQLAPLDEDQLEAGRLAIVSLHEAALRARTDGAPDPLAIADLLPPELRERFVAEDGRLLVLAWSEDAALDGLVAREQRLAAQAVAPQATSLSALLERLLVGERPWVRPVALGILALVVLVVTLDFRDLRYAVLALVPVLVGFVLTLGALCWWGMSFNVMTTLVIPLLLGLGVDDGIHVVHRMREDDLALHHPGLVHATTSVGRAIVMTTATTCSSFVILLFTDHPGLESMARVMLLGLPICFLTSVTVLPALARLWLTPGPVPAAETDPG